MENSNTTLELINKQLQHGLTASVGIKLLEISDNQAIATMPVDNRTKRPGGILNGGANIVLAETLAGIGSMALINTNTHNALGISVSSNHIGSASSGLVRGVAEIIHKGRTTHIWNINIYREDGKLISTSRVTNMIIEK